MDVSSSATIIITWIGAGVSLCLIIVRLALRRYSLRDHDTYRMDDIWIGLAVLLLITRAALVHAMRVLETNNVAHPEDLSMEEISRRVLGSKFIFASRIIFPTILWCAKCSLMVFFGKLVKERPLYKKFLTALWVTTIASLIAVILTLFLSCRPFRRVWQVLPNPGAACTQFVPYLLVHNALNMLTDILIMAFPLPLIFTSKLPRKGKIQVSSLFCLGLICVALTAIRTPLSFAGYPTQSSRTMWSSVEIMTAFIVTNAPALHGILREWRRRRISIVLADSPRPRQNEVNSHELVPGKFSDNTYCPDWSLTTPRQARAVTDEEWLPDGSDNDRFLFQRRTNVTQSVEFALPGALHQAPTHGPMVEIVADGLAPSPST